MIWFRADNLRAWEGEAIEKSNMEWVIALDITEETSVLLDVLQTTQAVSALLFLQYLALQFFLELIGSLYLKIQDIKFK